MHASRVLLYLQACCNLVVLVHGKRWRARGSMGNHLTLIVLLESIIKKRSKIAVPDRYRNVPDGGLATVLGRRRARQEAKNEKI